jgi:flagellar hook-basal body complex protein FliE
MIINGLGAIRPVGGTEGPAAVGGAAAAATGGMEFSKVLADVASSAVDALKAGEATSIAGINGNASVQQVVEAVMSAEQALQTAIAVRDKLVAAYQEISRMAI